MKRILIIEDDPEIAALQRDYLHVSGFETILAGSGMEGLGAAKDADLVILDVMLPGIDGFEVLKQLRECSDIPVILLSARAEDIDKIRGLGLGADDYIAKPFSPTELVARVKANIAQYERLKSRGQTSDAAEKKSAQLQAGPISVNLATHRVYLNEAEVDLKNKEYELLTFLLSNPDIVFSKEQLYERIWGMDAYGDLKTVAVHINRLREKIEKDPQNPVLIQTVWGAGYRFRV